MKTTSESPEEQFDLMVDSDDLLPPAAPVAIKPPGLGYERQQYLYKNIRRFVKDCYKDVLCPSPPEREDTPDAGPSAAPDAVAAPRGGLRGRCHRTRQPSRSPSPLRKRGRRGRRGGARGRRGGASE